MSNGIAVLTTMPLAQEKLSCLQSAAYGKTAVTRSRVRARCQAKIVKNSRREAEFAIKLNSIMRCNQGSEVVGALTVAQ
jgi:hypothetical protein